MKNFPFETIKYGGFGDIIFGGDYDVDEDDSNEEENEE